MHMLQHFSLRARVVDLVTFEQVTLLEHLHRVVLWTDADEGHFGAAINFDGRVLLLLDQEDLSEAPSTDDLQYFEVILGHLTLHETPLEGIIVGCAQLGGNAGRLVGISVGSGLICFSADTLVTHIFRMYSLVDFSLKIKNK